MNHSRSPQLSLLIQMTDPNAVLDEIKYILTRISDEIDLDLIGKVYNDVLRLFRGEYPGYCKCNTVYHNITHTTDTVLAAARLIHGATLSGKSLSNQNITLGVLAPIFHDTGYVQRISEKETGSTGAVYTLTHIQRSNAFVENYFRQNSLPAAWAECIKSMVRCTGLNVSLKDIEFQSNEIEFFGKVLGTADLLGQMADRTYVEKLLYLYKEFREAGIPGYTSEFDLLVKTLDFYQVTKDRIAKEYDSIDALMILHFRHRWGIDEDLYDKAIKKNLAYIKKITTEHPNDYRKYLRRHNTIVKE